MDFPGSVVTPTHVHPFGANGGAAFRTAASVNMDAISADWPSANLAIYIPMRLSFTYAVNRVFWVNGATGGANVDFGIYTPGGTRIYSTGSTAQSGTSVIQYVTPSKTFTLAPGRYLFALACSGTTGAVYGYDNSFGAVLNTARLLGFLQQASAVPLPATATFAALSFSALIPFCGVTRTTTGY